MAPFLSSWPWENLGSYKYLLYGPLVAKVLQTKPWEGGGSSIDLCCFHILLLCALRGLIYCEWTSLANLLFLSRNKRIIRNGVDYKQIDQEWDWDNFIMLQAMVGLMAYYTIPGLGVDDYVPVWQPTGFLVALLLHMTVSEPLFYWTHRYFHSWYFFYKNYHSHHHSVKVPQAFTAAYATPLEHLVMCAVMGTPLLGAFLLGNGSIGLVYAYVLCFDFVRAMNRSNLEVIPTSLFTSLPFLKYILSTPTYHHIHHTNKTSNFCLFMPLFDVLGGTLHEESWEMHRKLRSERKEEVPQFVFLAHVVDLMTALHSPFVFRTCHSLPFSTKLFMIPLWPVAFLAMLVMWVYSKPFLFSFYNLRGRLHQTWAVPRFGFQYFLPSAKDGINELIELAILRADKMGVKVISLAALNKNEALNGGGTLFVEKHPDLKVRVVHGNTLTAAVIIKEIPEGVEEVFLTGATSKLGRAISIYLSKKNIRVLMLTLSTERFQKIQKEAPVEFQHNLVQVTKYQAAQHCKTWIVGKWLTPMQQKWAPTGTHFHQFVVPPIFSFRRDCTYGKLAAMRLPGDVQGLGSCEYKLDRGVVHACHAGGVVHFLEGWTHHEVGALDVDRIDVVWEAAIRHGLGPV